MNSYISKKGYVLFKNNFSEKKLNEIKKELTVKPNINEDYGTKAKPYKVYKESKTRLYIPKFYGINKLGKTEVKTGDGKDIKVEFNGTIRDNQKEIVDKCIKQINNIGGGLLSLPCGFGKTVIALYLVSVLKKKCLVIVNQEFLMDQWIERINTFLPGLKIGKIQQKKVEVDGFDISLGMLKSLSKKDYEPDTFNDFGFVIVDECHNIATKEYSKALRKINSKYMLGLSATPKRKDGLTKVITWYIGNIFLEIERKAEFDVNVERYIIQSDNDFYKKVFLNYKGRPMLPKMITRVAEYYKRTNIICTKILEVTENKNNQILLLSERLAQLKDIEKNIKGKVEYGYFVGGMKQKAREESMTKQVILATFHIAREALDIKSLNVLFLATPKSDIIQAVGRILRDSKINNHLIVDFVDNFSSFANQAKRRLTYFRKKNYNIKTFEIEEDGTITNSYEDDYIPRCRKKKSINKEPPGPLFAFFNK